MKSTSFMLMLAVPLLSACAGLTGPVIMGADAVGIYETKPGALPPANTQDQIPAHQSWCYSSMGDSECFAHAQNVPPERLINVDPQSAYPLDRHAYRQSLIAKQDGIVAVPEPVLPAQLSAVPVPDVQLEKAKLKDEINGDSATIESTAPQSLLSPPLAAPKN